MELVLTRIKSAADKKQCPFDDLNKMIKVAIENNHFGVIKYIKHRKIKVNYFDLIYNAPKSSVKMVILLTSVGLIVDGNLMLSAAAHGNLELVKYLHNKRGLLVTQNCIDFAASEGHTKMVDYLESEALSLQINIKAVQMHLRVKQMNDNDIINIIKKKI